MNILSPVAGQKELPSCQHQEIVKQEAALSWKNPGQSLPEELDRYCCTDQERATDHINNHWVLAGSLDSQSGELNWKFGQNPCVLDIGCGPGYSTFQIALKADRSYRIFGADIKKNIDYARKMYQRPNLSYLSIDSPVELPPAPQDCPGYKLISAFAFFSWIPKENQLQVLQAIMNILAPEGKLLARFTAIGDRPYRTATERVIKQPKWESYFIDYTPPFVDQSATDFQNLLEEAGFVNIEISVPQSEFFYKDKQTLAKYMMQWLPGLSRLYADGDGELKRLHQEFCLDVIAEMCLDIGSDDFNIPLKMPALLISAQKRQNFNFSINFGIKV